MNSNAATSINVRNRRTIMKFVLGVLLSGAITGVLIALPIQNLFAQGIVSTSESSSSDSSAIFSCSTINQIPQIECQALISLYDSTNGHGWINRSGWLTTDTPCSWYGVSCRDNAGHVTALNVKSNRLSGIIPAQLCALEYLAEGSLDLGFNGLLGGPACIGSKDPDWATTQSVLESVLRPTPTPPPISIGDLGSVTLDNIQTEQIGPSNLISARSDMTNSRGPENGGSAPLDYISLASFSQGFDDVTQLPGQNWFFQNNSLPQGTTTWFQGNDAVFPAHAGTPDAYIAANFNNTAGVGVISNWMLTPMFNLVNGNVISFWTRAPADSAWPDRLELRLSTAGTSINVGSTGTSVGDFTRLLLSINSSLTLGGYPEAWTRYSVTLTGLPNGARGRFAFRYFVTDGGPSGINSSYIGIDTVEFTGSLASFSCSTVSEIPQIECEALVALYNSTTGPGWTNNGSWLITNTPCSWEGIACEAGHVVVIWLVENQLTGTLPASLGNLTNLQYLNVFQNRLAGQIPPQLGNLSSLLGLDLGQNQLGGTIPSQLGSLSNMSYFSIYINQIGGSIPPELGNLTNLRVLDFYDNRLNGSIPAQLSNLSNLDFFRLNNNLLSGSIPAELSQLTNVTLIDFNRNRLSGSIPSQLGSLTNLQSLELGGNQLNGNIPWQLGNLSALQLLRLDSNQLNGSIPAQLCALNGLTENSLALGFNKLSDGPACIASKDPDWTYTQTVPPGNLHATAQSPSQVRLTWTPILYAADGGFYEVGYAINPGGPFTVHGTTADKIVASYNVTGLSPSTLYYFRIRTFTPAHGSQQNDLWSSYGSTVSSMTGSISRLQYLPLVLRRLPSVPNTPALHAIIPPGANYSYSITWSPTTSATSYLLQRATSVSFADATQVYSGSSTVHTASSQGIAHYYYRVQARNQWGGSPWSNAQSVEVRWEREPNDTSGTANGLLSSGLDYYGLPNDASDYFVFQTTSRGQVTIDLNNHTAQDIQLLLYYPAGNLIRQDIHPPYHIEYTGDSGRYYVRIYSTGGFNNVTPYTLRAAFQSVVNGGFEAGLAGWTVGGNYAQPQVRSNVMHSGAKAAALGNSDELCTNIPGPRNGDSWVSQYFRVPSSGNPELRVWYRIFSWDRNQNLTDDFDRFEVELNGNRVLRDANTSLIYGCGGPPVDLGWKLFRLNLSAYKGQWVTMKLTNIVWPDEAYNTWTYVDDISVD